MSRGKWMRGLLTGVVVVGGVLLLLRWMTRGDRAEVGITLAVVLLAALIHEGGHLGAAWLLGVPVRGVRMGLLGARLELGGLLSYRQESLIAAAGPTVNFLTAAMLWSRVAVWDAGWGSRLCMVSVGLAAVNLLPVRGLDGGRILRCLLASLFGVSVADGVVGVTTATCLFAAWLAFGYLLLRTGDEAGMFLFFSLMVLQAIRRGLFT